MKRIYPILIAVTLGPLAIVGVLSAAQRNNWGPTLPGSLLALGAAYGAYKLKAPILALAFLFIGLFGLASLSPSF